jgi:DNA polymerase III delta subunit
MLYVLYGTDGEKLNSKLDELIESMLTKKPNASVKRFDAETFIPGQIEELVHEQGLFADRSIVVFSQVCADPAGKEVLAGALKDLVASQNVFILIEHSLDARTRERFKKAADKFQEFQSEEQTAAAAFNIFSLTDALARRDRKRLWILYRQARTADASDEEIVGTLFWQVKSALLSQAGTPQQAGLSPFVFKKARGMREKYTDAELKELSAHLVAMYHDARQGKRELGVALESFILQDV